MHRHLIEFQTRHKIKLTIFDMDCQHFVLPNLKWILNSNCCKKKICVFSTFSLYRLKSSLIGLVAISANPAENTPNIVANGTQRTAAPTIIKSIHNINGNGTVSVNMTNSEPLSEYCIQQSVFWSRSPNSPRFDSSC